MSLLTSTNTTELSWARSHRADIRITPDHPVFGWQPHSFQYGGCQKSGLPINVPSAFVTSDTVLAKGKLDFIPWNSEFLKKLIWLAYLWLRNAGMRMAREWAHYRYGVFDEGGMPDDQRHPSGYLMFQTESSEKILRPNTCSDLITPSGSWNKYKQLLIIFVLYDDKFLTQIFEPTCAAKIANLPLLPIPHANS